MKLYERLTIADILHYGCFLRRAFVGIDFANRPSLARWFDRLAAVIAFFASDDAAFITGQPLFVDGGSSLAKAS